MLSLNYYETIFDHNSAKITGIKRLLIADFKQMEQAFFEADAKRNLVAMKGELHKISPIVANLKDEEFSSLLEKYKALTEYQDDIQNMHSELKNRLLSVYEFLK